MGAFIYNGQIINASDLSCIANAYSSNSTYAQGSYCVYTGTVYRCDTAVTVAEAFDPSKWTSIVVMNELKALFDSVSSDVDDINSIHTFALATTDWVANTDPTTSTDYPYTCTKSSTLYSNSSAPIWDLVGAGSVTTSTEKEAMDAIAEAYFSSTGIVLYATEQPTVALTLRVKGIL